MLLLSRLPGLSLSVSCTRCQFPFAHELQNVMTVVKVENNGLYSTIIPVFENKLHC